ncbi:conserved hypothetical protein [Hyella patelloides LEGE 07179]|uniref:Aminoglycoside phosphotransferase domain-containing protein n=1 Tax=Hyella patelloides LEGE 07179 TaxID=945734 RepID=A0A563VXK7_9CYAN|nr:T3SS effector HopA1 family protein [Hyella patelloides]VEP16156.1 conserved hypothetical protein [Hyella patelloides LEGE 07179]
MNLLLSNKNIVDFLKKNKIVDINEQINTTNIESKICKNFNLLVSLSEKRLVLVKQEPHDRNGETKGDFSHEWQFYQLIRYFSDLKELSSLCSPATYFDRKNAILVFNYLSEYCDLEEFYTQHNIFPTKIAAFLGETLAKFHCLTFDNQDYESFLEPERETEGIPDFSKDLERIYPEIFGLISSDGIKFYELYQRDPNLHQAIASLQELYEPCCLVHDDLKFNNILLHLDWQELDSQQNKQSSLIRLIDWEKWSWGDPALDLGSIVASYLKLWLNSITVNRYISIEQALSLAGTPLEQIQPSLVVLFQSYCQCFPEVLTEFPDFLVRVMQFAGLGLIDSILAKLHYYEPFGNISICMLQVAKTLLCHPEKSIPTVFGLTTEELLNKEGTSNTATFNYDDLPENLQPLEEITETFSGLKDREELYKLLTSDRYNLVIEDIASKIKIDPDYSLSYGDRKILALPDKLQDYFTHLSQSQQETYLQYQLRDFLHEIYFSNEQISESDSPIELENNIHRGVNIDFYQQLSSSNSGVGYDDPDWNVLSNPHQGFILAQKNGLTLHIDLKRHLFSSSKSHRKGDTVAIRLPHNRIEAEFYVAVGDAGIINEDAPIISIYFNVDPQGAIALTKNLTQQFNIQKIAFEFSVLINPEDYYRFDATYLRIERKHYPKIQAILTEIYQQTRSHFQSQIPLFTKRLAAGIGLAEEPINESQEFGLHRCQIIAEALLIDRQKERSRQRRGAVRTAKLARARALKEKINLIQQSLIQHGIDLEHPYLNGGDDIYSVLSVDG